MPKRLGFWGLLVLALTTTACGGGGSSSDSDVSSTSSSAPAAPQPETTTPTSGSVGDGPVVGATVEVFDSNGNLVIEGTSSSTASYTLDIPDSTSYPLLIVASGGTDVVSGAAPDFPMSTLQFNDASETANITPMTTILVRSLQCDGSALSRANLNARAATLYQQYSFGVDNRLVPDLFTTAITAATAPSIVKSSEVVAEWLRRTARATGQDINTTVDAIACDLADGLLDGQGPAGTVRERAAAPDTLLAGSAIVELAAVMLEATSNELRVGGTIATNRLDQAISTLLPNTTLSTSSVAITEQLLEETMASVLQVAALTQDGVLVDVFNRLGGLTAGSSAAESRRIIGELTTVRARLTGAQTAALAADAEQLAALLARQATGAEAPAPTLALDFAPRDLTPGDLATVSWTSENVVACTGEDGVQQADLGASGSIRTPPITSDIVATLVCVGPGGSVRSSITIGPNANAQALPIIRSMAAQPSSVAFNGTSRISWTVENATSCVGVDGTSAWRRAQPLTNTGSTLGPLSQATSFGLECSNAQGSSRRTVAVQVAQPPLPPTLVLQATPETIVRNTATNVSWTGTNLTSCVASSTGQLSTFTGPAPTTGQVAAVVSQPTIFSLLCTGPSGVVEDSVSVGVFDNPVPNLTADRLRISSNGTVSLTWAPANAETCTASSAPAFAQWSGDRPVAGATQILDSFSGDIAFTLTCASENASTSETVFISIIEGPIADLQAAAAQLPFEGTAMLQWSSSSSQTCTATATPQNQQWNGNLPLQGSRAINGLQASTTFVLNCSGIGGSDTASANVAITPRPTLLLSAAPEVVPLNGATTLNWESEGATSCTAQGNWTGSRPVNGSEAISNVAEALTYSLRCTGPGGSVVRTLQVTPGTLGITWQPPTKNADGSALNDLAGYRVKYGTASRQYSDEIPLNSPTATTASFNLDTAGEYFFAVTAIDTDGNESPLSREISTTVGAVSSPRPTVAIAANFEGINPGDSVALSWLAEDASNCVASGAWGGNRSTSGTFVAGTVNETSLFVLTCEGPGGIESDQVEVRIIAEAELTLTASNVDVTAGAHIDLTWSSVNVDNCVASEGWSGTRTTNGTATIAAIAASTLFTLSCTGPAGNVSSSVFVAVQDVVPSVTEVFISAAPTVVAPGGTSTLIFQTANVTNCQASGGWSGEQPLAGAQSVLPDNSRTTYTLTCQGAEGPVSASTDVIVSGAVIPDVIAQFLVADSGSGIGRPITIGMPFAEGALATDSKITVVDENGTPLPTQWNELATWRTDSSILHGAVSFLTPLENSSGVYGIRIGTPQTGTAVSKADVVASGFNAEIRVSTGQGEYSLKARDLFNGSVTARQDYVHFEGPMVSQFVLGAPLRSTANDTPHATLQGFFHVRAYGKPVTEVYVSLVLENTGTFAALADIPADVELFVGDTSRYENTGFTVKADARYPKRYWWNSDPNIWVQHDVEYIQDTKLVPEYRELEISENLLSEFVQSVDWHEIGELRAAMDGAGAQRHIAPMDRWSTAYLISGDQRAYNALMAHDDAYHWAAHRNSYAVHPRDERTGFPVDMAQNPTIIGNSWGGPLAIPAARQSTTPLRFDLAHMPEAGYLPYLLTVEYDRLEQSQFWAIVPWHRTGTSGWPRRFIGRLQIRGLAWSLRNMISAAIITPDNHPLKETLDGAVTNIFEVWNTEYRPTSSFGAIINGDGSGETIVYSSNSTPNPLDNGTATGFAPWQDDFVTYSVGSGYERGWAPQLDASGFWDWKAQFSIGRSGLGPEFCWINAVNVAFGLRDTNESPNYATLAEIHAKNFPETIVCPGAGQAAMARRDTSAVDVGAQHQAAVAMTLSTNRTNSAEAWDTLERRMINWFIQAEDAPEWALQPRQ